MNKTVRSVLVLSALVSFANVASAAKKEDAKDCQFVVTRTPCSPATREEALGPYDGKETAAPENAKKATDEKSCIAEAEASKGIKRTTILSKKVTVAMFKGKKVGEFTATSDCK